MDERYYIQIEVLDKIDELLEIFKEYSPKIFSNSDEGYDWIEEDFSRCLVIENPYYDENIELNIGDGGEFCLFFGNNHVHYSAYQLDYDVMVKKIKAILKNEACAGYLTDINGKWYGSGFYKIEEINKAPKDVFDHVFKTKEFYNKLTNFGYVAEYYFWNPKDNKNVEISKKHHS